MTYSVNGTIVLELTDWFVDVGAPVTETIRPSSSDDIDNLSGGDVDLAATMKILVRLSRAV
jgi:hypothetical protein